MEELEMHLDKRKLAGKCLPRRGHSKAMPGCNRRSVQVHLCAPACTTCCAEQLVDECPQVQGHTSTGCFAPLPRRAGKLPQPAQVKDRYRVATRRAGRRISTGPRIAISNIYLAETC